MKLLRNVLDKFAPLFEEGGKLEKLFPLWEATDTFLYSSGSVTKSPSHVRDALDLKRMMVTVVMALTPCVLMALYNTGLQANLALDPAAVGDLTGWRYAILDLLGVGYSPTNVLACLIHGALYFLPVYAVTLAAGGAWEVLFALVRKHEINEGFLVTSLLFPLILPPTIPLWQVAVGSSFGIVIGKEVFGGVGMNILNPALTARAFLYFGYPGEISGDKIWTAIDPAHALDGFSGATALAFAKDEGVAAFSQGGFFSLNLTDGHLSWLESFLGFEPGSMGETSALACLLGAAFLIVTRVASWRTMAGIGVGATLMATVFNLVGSDTNAALSLPIWWHFVLGGFAFGAVFMATDPVSSAFTDKGKWIYGFLIGLMIVLIRCLNPAFPESVMLVILFMNVFAPLIDHFIVQGNIKRRAARNAA
ncbi:MAG: NADH:ubiquinone reductase (Na(+)-transporting) subunit B [Nitrospiraceae bacterium]|nr:NADH:ubiquinone reductase (Na(+)-transporting) subunit B [Nitrospiraceae bacterium]